MRIANALTMLSAFLPMANGTGLFGLANRIRQGRRWAQVGGNPISYVDPDQAYQKSSPQSIRNPPDSQAIAQAWVKTSAIDPGQEFDIKMTVQALTKHQDQYTVVIESFSLDDPSMSVNHIERRLSVGNTSPVRRWLPLLLAVGVIGLAVAGLAWLIYL